MFIVTGANGFIGSAMVWELNQRGHQDILAVDLIDLQSRSELLKPLKISEFMTAKQLLSFLPSTKKKITAIFHMGACSNTTEMNVDYLREINTEYTQKMFNFARLLNCPLIYASSGAVYGDGKLGFDDQPTSENYKPLNPYGWSKVNFDVWAEKQKETPARWYGLRFFNVYGPNEYFKGDMSSVAFKAVQQIHATGRLKLFRSHNPQYKDGEQLRDFVYVKDITRWMWEIFTKENCQSGIYNLGYGQARSWLDLAHGVFSNLKRPVQIEWMDVPANIRSQYQYFTEAKMDKLLGQGLSQPQWPLEKGITDYLQAYLCRDNPYLHT